MGSVDSQCQECGKGSVPDQPLPTPSVEQIAAAPAGTIRHRLYRCPRLEPLRKKRCPPEMVKRELSSPVADTDLALERGLFPVPFMRVPPPGSEETFHWQVRPEGDMVSGTFYSDGSLLDGPSKLLGRCGWAFVALDSNGFVVAAAYGITPPWISCIPGAESWAALQAARVAWPGSTFRIDCEPCVLAIHPCRHGQGML